MKFQSLGRDSVCLDSGNLLVPLGNIIVSIPRSGFCLFGLHQMEPSPDERAMFQSLGRDSVCLDARMVRGVLSGAVTFQSLGRDSVCLDAETIEGATGIGVVSIPRSGFCLFGLHVLIGIRLNSPVSIPRSGFCLFGLNNCIFLMRGARRFNPSVGILFVWTM